MNVCSKQVVCAMCLRSFVDAKQYECAHKRKKRVIVALKIINLDKRNLRADYIQYFINLLYVDVDVGVCLCLCL